MFTWRVALTDWLTDNYITASTNSNPLLPIIIYRCEDWHYLTVFSVVRSFWRKVSSLEWYLLFPCMHWYCQQLLLVTPAGRADWSPPEESCSMKGELESPSSPADPRPASLEPPQSHNIFKVGWGASPPSPLSCQTTHWSWSWEIRQPDWLRSFSLLHLILFIII